MNGRLLLLSLLALIVALVHTPARAQALSGTIAGAVVHADGTPVEGAAVEVLGTSPRLGSWSRADGSYRVRGIRPGTYRLRISAADHAVDTIAVKVEAGRELALGITLEAAPAHGMVEVEVAPIARDRAIAVHGGRGATEKSIRVEALAAAPPSMAPLYGDAETASGADEPAPTLAAKVSPSAATARAGEATTTTTEPSKPERPGQLTAGEWCDLTNWTYWLDVASSEEWSRLPAYWGFDPSSRISVVVTDGERLIADAEVSLSDGQNGTLWRARTDNHGRAELFVGVAGKPAGTYRVEVRSGEATAILNNVSAGAAAPLLAKLRAPSSAASALDLMFVIDATGSMGDELNYVKSELESVIDRVRDNQGDRVAMRISANFYRDQGDEYVVRSFPFTESSFDAIGWIRDQVADNGGDFPEAVEEALADAIDKHEWSPSARARLMFLVLDAPPHYDAGRVEQLHALARRAAEKGIRIIPVASSGVDKETEFLLRLLAIYSGGTYTFLTDDSGIGNSHLKPSIGRFDVEYLDDLIVRLIGRWLEDGTLSEEMRAALR
jgi:hypothetical protein